MPEEQTERRKASILLVDDHPIVRDGLAQMIAAQPDMEVCGQAGSVTEAIVAVEHRQPDLALVDVFLNGGNGIELTKVLRGRFPDVIVLILSMHDEEVYALRAMRAGASGYIVKQQASRTILEAIRTVLRGERWVGMKLETILANEAALARANQPLSPLGTLTDRELQIFEAFGRGASRNDIAERLHLSVKTVEAHRANIREKLGIASSAELLRQAVLWVESVDTRD
jgi:DNA-binding NarL/FixJ family response regulator